MTMETAHTGRVDTEWLGLSPEQARRLAAAGLRPVWGAVDTEVLTGATEAVQRWAARVWIEASREI